MTPTNIDPEHEGITTEPGPIPVQVQGSIGNHAATVSTFWHGAPLSALERACLTSFVKAGHEVRVYTYGPIGDVPEGVELRDAGTVTDFSRMSSYRIKGKVSLSHFADLFRYELFQRTGSAWIDTDVVCLPSKHLPNETLLLGRQTDTSLNNAVLRIPSDDPRLATLIAATKAMAGTDFKWGATGPDLVTRVFGQQVLDTSKGPSTFYPVHWDDWFMPFLPSMRERCATLCQEAITLHLWNEIIEKSGFWKELAPPEGSFLYGVFEEWGVLNTFRGVYPEKVMTQLYENWRHGITGERFQSIDVARLAASRLFQDRHKPVVRRLRQLQSLRLFKGRF